MRYDKRRGAASSWGRRSALAAVLSLSFSLAAPVTAAQAGPVITEKCQSILQWQVPISSVDAGDVQDLLAELAAHDIPATVAQLVAYIVPTSDGMTQLLGRSAAEFKLCLVSTLGEGRETSQIVAVPTAVPFPELASTTLDGHQEPYWADANDDCFKVENNRFERRVCWDVNFQRNDSDPDKHHWQFFSEASGHRKVDGEYMARMWVEGKPIYPYSDYQYFQGLPKPNQDYSGGEDCSSESLTLTVSSGAPVQGGAEMSSTITKCERYSIRQYEDDGHWAHIWQRRDGSYGTEGYRYVAFNMPIETPQDVEQDNRVGWELLTGQEIKVPL